MTSASQHRLVTHCSTLVSRLAEGARAVEERRRVDPDVVRELAGEGYYRMLVPRCLGGEEVAPRDFARVLATLATGDAATAWCVMTGATTGLVSAYLPDAGADELFARRPGDVFSGVFAPTGRAIREGDGYRVSGRWRFASGCENSQWIMVGAIVMDGDRPEQDAAGRPRNVSMFLPAEDVEIIDTWSVSGLCGTGSHDVSVSGALVPSRRTASLIGHPPLRGEGVVRFPVFGILASGVAAVALGIARGAVDEVCELLRGKRTPSGRGAAEGELAQVRIAELWGECAAARAVLESTLDEIAALPDAELSVHERARVRLAACQAVRGAVRAVDAAYTLGGGAALYDACPLSRRLRDVHAVTQHVMVAAATERLVGRALLGLDGDYGVL